MSHCIEKIFTSMYAYECFIKLARVTELYRIVDVTIWAEDYIVVKCSCSEAQLRAER